MRHALRRVDTGDEALADLDVIVGFEDDLAEGPGSPTASAASSPRSTRRRIGPSVARSNTRPSSSY
jgi:hypothetical protein